MKIPMTPSGYEKLKSELQKLKSQRPDLAKAIELARAHGDLSENADYDAAKNNSGMVEAKIRSIEGQLAQAQVINPKEITDCSRVKFGLSIKTEDLDSGEEKVYTIVGSEESDVDKGWISYETPLAKAFMNKEEGDVVTVKLPAGAKEFEIVEIFVSYGE